MHSAKTIWPRMYGWHAGCSLRLVLEQFPLQYASLILLAYAPISATWPFWNSWFFAQKSLQYSLFARPEGAERPTQCPCAAFALTFIHTSRTKTNGRQYRTCTFTLPPRSVANSEGWHPCNQQFPHGQNSKRFLRPPSAKPGTDREPQLRRTAIVRYSVLKRPNIETYEYGIENLMISA